MKVLYSLVTIEQSATPLAPAPKSAFASALPWITGALVVLVLVLVGMLTTYVLRCKAQMRQIEYILEEYKLEGVGKLPKWDLKELNLIRQDLEEKIVMGNTL